MVTVNEAESTLKTIRSLMERATIYRAISAPAALVAGLSSILLSTLAIQFQWSSPVDDRMFILAWVGVALLVSACNLALIYRNAMRREEPFISPGMKLAMRGISPALIAGAAVTATEFWRGPSIPDLVTMWMLFYGLALLSTREFAPSSIRFLGYAFVASGIATAVLWASGLFWNGLQFGRFTMELSFGFLHFFYAIAVLWRKSREALAAATNDTEA